MTSIHRIIGTVRGGCATFMIHMTRGIADHPRVTFAIIAAYAISDILLMTDLLPHTATLAGCATTK